MLIKFYRSKISWATPLKCLELSEAYENLNNFLKILNGIRTDELSQQILKIDKPILRKFWTIIFDLQKSLLWFYWHFKKFPVIVAADKFSYNDMTTFLGLEQPFGRSLFVDNNNYLFIIYRSFTKICR